jgi:hypothetical protein
MISLAFLIVFHKKYGSVQAHDASIIIHLQDSSNLDYQENSDNVSHGKTRSSNSDIPMIEAHNFMIFSAGSPQDLRFIHFVVW